MIGSEQTTGALALTLARQWLGTPYRHQGALRGIGCDCLGLIRGVWRDLYGHEPETPGAYRIDWAVTDGREHLLEAALRQFGAPVDPGARQPGDVLLFRWRAHLPVSHAGIYAGEGQFIHAYEQLAVTLSPLVPAWQRRLAATFRFPAIEGEG